MDVKSVIRLEGSSPQRGRRLQAGDKRRRFRRRVRSGWVRAFRSEGRADCGLIVPVFRRRSAVRACRISRQASVSVGCWTAIWNRRPPTDLDRRDSRLSTVDW